MTSRKLAIVSSRPGALDHAACHLHHPLGARRAPRHRSRAPSSSDRRRGRIIALERFGNDCGDIEEADAPGEEGRDRHLVGGVEHRRPRAARVERRARQRERRESVSDPAPRNRAGRSRRNRAARHGVAIRSGQASACAIGVRMSGVPSCASIEPSTYSTIEWITDCGWTSDLDPIERRPGTDDAPRSARAPCSSSSRESTEIFAPIDQLGCFDRLRRRHRRHLRRATRSRNGPPLAVRMMRRTRSGARMIEALEDRVMLGIDRQQRRAVRARAPSSHQRAGGDQRLLVGQRDRAARRRAPPSPARSPAQPTIAAIVQSAPRAAASTTASAPRRRLDAAAGERLAQRGSRARIGDHRAARRACAARPRRARATSRCAVSASTAKRSGSRSIRSSVEVPTDPVAPRMVTRRGSSAASRSADQQRRRAPPPAPPRRAGRARRHARAAAARSPSPPPCRLSQLSNRSPHLRQHRQRRAEQPAARAAGRTRRRSPTPTSSAATTPPPSPAQVLFGLSAGASFGPPIARPAK